MFDVPSGKRSAALTLFASKGSPDSSVMFDDVRVVPATRSPKGTHYYFEDFENLDEGWGPFVYGYNGPCRTHISETHKPYTNDTITGRYSFKTEDEPHVGCVTRTLPSTLKLAPNTWYTLSFDYLVSADDRYKLVIDKPFVDNRTFDAKYSSRITPSTVSSWKDVAKSGSTNKTVDNGKLKIASSGNAFIVDDKAPVAADGYYSCTIRSTQSGRCGAVIRYISETEHCFIGYDTGSKWVWGCGSAYGTLTNSGPNIMEDGKDHKLDIRFVENHYTISVDGKEIFNGFLGTPPTAAGKVGFRNWYNSKAVYSDISLQYGSKPLTAEQAEENKKIFSAPLTAPAGTFTATFKTKNSPYTFIGLEKLNREPGTLVIDNFTVDTGRL